MTLKLLLSHIYEYFEEYSFLFAFYAIYKSITKLLEL